MEEGQYRLRATLLGHSMDVRGVAVGRTEGGKEFIISGSRDRSSKIWMPSDSDPCSFTLAQSCDGHTNFVSCVSWIPPSDLHPQGLILSGSHDHTILAFELGKTQPIFRLVGHKGTVCSVGGTGDGLIVSGSWDLTARVWKDQCCVASLSGHTAAVWAIATVPGSVGEHRILTGSADKDIRLWVNYEAARLFQGHTDCVRTLTVISEEKFLSGSNDASVKMWNINTGEVLATLYGHSNFIYSLSLAPDGMGFASVGEDRTLRVWRGHETKQVLFHPATSVWCVACLSNGDIATGSSDGTLRVFTAAKERTAPEETLRAFEEEVSKSVVAAQQDLGGMKVSELPGPESLFAPGKADGETKMVREGDKVGCYSWSVAEKKWSKVGDVVGASGATQNTSGKVLFEGKEYDYVFSVDLDEGKTLKLPFNITEDPWHAAQRFIHKNGLSQLFLDQVANFIITNTKGVQLGTAPKSQNDFADPFTGEGRYIPGSGSGTAVGGGGGLDPFTGSGAYRTGSGAPVPAKVSGSDASLGGSGPCFPVTEFVRFAAAPNYDSLRKKLVEFVGVQGINGDYGAMIEALLDIGRKAEWDDTTANITKECLANWPEDKIFPVLDLLRLGVVNTEFAKKFAASVDVTTEFSGKFMVNPAQPVNQMLVLRLLCNGFGPLSSSLMGDRGVVLTQMLSHLRKAKGNEVAAATLVLNYSILIGGFRPIEELQNGTGPAGSKWNTFENQTELLMTATQMIEQVEDPEAQFRLLVAIGNLTHGNSATSNLFQSLGGLSIITVLKQGGATLLEKLRFCCDQLETSVNASLTSAASGPGPSARS